MGEHDQGPETSDAASEVWHIEVDKRPLPARILRTFATVVWGLLTEGGAVSPSNQVWLVVETATGRVLTNVKQSYGDESDTGAQLASELETYSPSEFAARWGFKVTNP